MSEQNIILGQLKKKVVLIMFFIRKKSIDQINANRVSFNLLNKQNVNKLLSVKEKGKKIHAYYRFQASFFFFFNIFLFR